MIFPENEQLTDDGDVLTFDPPNVDLDSEVLDLGEPIGLGDNTFFSKGDGFLDDILNGRFETPIDGEEGTYYLASEISGTPSDDEWAELDESNDPTIMVSPEAKAIANGHGYAKHKNQFPGVETRDDYAELIDSIINTVPEENIRDDLTNGRKAYWDDATETLVITDPGDIDGGTAYKPDKGKDAFFELK